jgi:hypothetical protein
MLTWGTSSSPEPDRRIVPEEQLMADIAMSAAGAQAGRLDGTPIFFHWGVVQISAANLIVIALMIIVFVVALLLPFPKDRSRP